MVLILLLIFSIIDVEPANKFDIVNHVLYLQPPKQSEDVDVLILQLGDLNFQKRENAFIKLKKLDVKACVAIAKHINNIDPEIKYRTRLLLRSLREVNGFEGIVPDIWELPNRLRFSDGYEKDVAKDYYEEIWNAKQNAKALEFLDPDSFIRPEISYGDSTIAKHATIKYIGDLREKGLEVDHAIILLNLMNWNDKHLYHVYYEFSWGRVPSCLLLERIKEGVFWKEKEKNTTVFSFK